MAPAPDWETTLKQTYGDMLIETMRYRFSDENLSSAHLERLIQASPHRDAAVRLDASQVSAIAAAPDGLLDISAFDSPEDFVQRGCGFYMSHGEDTVSLAYASLACSTGIEVSIFVQPGHRRQGMATLLGALLARQALARGVEPHWDAANPESCALAEKLGYTPAGTYKAFYLRPETSPG